MIGIAAGVVFALELWRRALRGRTPRWVHVIAILSSIEIVVGVIYAEYQLYQALHHVTSANASNKATMLANDISRAMRSNAVAIVGVLLEIIVLVIGTVLARRTAHSDDAPRAKVYPGS